jgi:hypothetical protein
MMVKVINHRVGDGARHLSSAGAVEVGDRAAIMQPLKSREMHPDFRSSSNFCRVLTLSIQSRTLYSLKAQAIVTEEKP